MLNRFRNAIYGSSNDFREPSSSAGIRTFEKADDQNDDNASQPVGLEWFNYRQKWRSSSLRSQGHRISSSKSQVFIRDHSDLDRNPRLIRNGITDAIQSSDDSSPKVSKFRYSRPEFLQLKTDDEISVSADHRIRPIILPRDASKLPWRSGYAECINAGKSMRNEDQAACHQEVVVDESVIMRHYNMTDSTTEGCGLPWVYFGIFDGHAGPDVAVGAARQLHDIIKVKIANIADLLIALELGRSFGHHELINNILDHMQSTDDKIVECHEPEEETIDETNQSVNSQPESASEAIGGVKLDIESSSVGQLESTPSKDLGTGSNPHSTKNRVLADIRDYFPKPDWSSVPRSIGLCKNHVTIESLIVGVLESAFWEMDDRIGHDKLNYHMRGGCTAVVSLFILGKLYVSNAGDSRAILSLDNRPMPMSFDFTPNSERERILRLGMERPEFLGKEFTQLEFAKRPTRQDLGKRMLYKDAFMTGWSAKRITYDDLRLPLVSGEGKRSRALCTIGVTRGFGDHELKAIYGSVPIKPFLTPEPEVRVLDLKQYEDLTPEDVLIMASDGLWDVTSNEKASEIVRNSFNLFADNEESRTKYRYITAAQDLVIHSRGHADVDSNIWRISDLKLASLDDISVFVIPLKQHRDEYLEWHKTISKRIPKRMMNHVVEQIYETGTVGNDIIDEDDDAYCNDTNQRRSSAEMRASKSRLHCFDSQDQTPVSSMVDVKEGSDNDVIAVTEIIHQLEVE